MIEGHLRGERQKPRLEAVPIDLGEYKFCLNESPGTDGDGVAHCQN